MRIGKNKNMEIIQIHTKIRKITNQAFTEPSFLLFSASSKKQNTLVITTKHKYKCEALCDITT